jgi:hypothetical protein
LLEFWNGMSSFGGFAGALAGLTVGFARRSARVRLAVAEVLLQALVVGGVFGRLGCTLVHDHIGKPSDFWLAIRFPDGPRHDLGLYELLFTLLVLVPAVVLLNRRPRQAGATIATIALLYAPARFAADFLRNTDLASADPRYLGLTLAQYACIVSACVGLAFAAPRPARAVARPGTWRYGPPMIDHRARTLEVNDATYAAWNAHDADAVAAVFRRRRGGARSGHRSRNTRPRRDPRARRNASSQRFPTSAWSASSSSSTASVTPTAG